MPKYKAGKTPGGYPVKYKGYPKQPAKPASPPKVTPGGKVVPSSSPPRKTRSATPTQTDVVIVPPSTEKVSSGGLSSSAGMVVLLASLLGFAFEWNNFTVPLWNTIWNKQPLKLGTTFPSIIGVVVFIAVIGVLASFSEDMAGLMLLIVLGMWLIFIMFNGSGTIKSIANFLTPQGGIQQTGNGLSIQKF